MAQILNLIFEKFNIENLNVFIFNLILAVILFAIGIFLGKVVKFILKKLMEKSGSDKTLTKSFVELFLAVVKWSIYLLFISLALEQINIPQLTGWLTSLLLAIPAFVGSLLLISVGFVIAVYLRDIIEESNILSKKILSMIFFYFIIYVFMVFALKTALIKIDKNTVNLIIIILTGIVAASVAYRHIKKK